MSMRPAGNFLRHTVLDGACWRCSQRLNATTTLSPSIALRSFASTTARKSTTGYAIRSPPRARRDNFFLHNGFLPRRSSTSTTDRAGIRLDANHFSANLPQPQQLPPHRRRQAAKRNAAAASPPVTEDTGDSDGVLPANSSSTLTTASTKHPSSSIRRQLALFLSLSKPRLTVLVVLSSMATYAIYPVPAFLSPSIGLDTPSLSPLTLAFLTMGTTLCSASANALNMLYETATDAKMTRTRNRPLVRKLLSKRRALGFAIVAAVAGVGSLYFGVNPTTAFLGAANIALYAGVYTPMKRLSWWNTWVGAIVGGIPPLMGWAAAAGESATGDGSFQELLLTRDAIGGWLMGSLLVAWQFPHFMALSWSLRDEYRAAGHQMLSWINPARNARVALRYSALFFPICFGLCYVGVTDWSFAVTSLATNYWLTREAVRFWRHQGFQGSAKGLFWASVWHLPVVMVLAVLQKKGMWARVWRAVAGEPDFSEEDFLEDEWVEVDAEAIAGQAVPTTIASTESKK